MYSALIKSAEELHARLTLFLASHGDAIRWLSVRISKQVDELLPLLVAVKDALDACKPPAEPEEDEEFEIPQWQDAVSDQRTLLGYREWVFKQRADNGFWEVTCGNIGHVHDGHDELEARRVYEIYKAQSKGGAGRAGGEEVVLWLNHDVHESYDPDQQ